MRKNPDYRAKFMAKLANFEQNLNELTEMGESDQHLMKMVSKNDKGSPSENKSMKIK